MTILVVGAAGVLGRNTIPRLIERGHTVRAIARGDEQTRHLQHAGATAFFGDIFDLSSLVNAAQGCEVALHLATAIPRPPSQDWSLNDRIRREGTENLLAAAAESGVKRYIQQSISLLYGEQSQPAVDESASLKPSSRTQSAVDMEELVKGSSLDWCILRGALFYGANTGLDRWRQAALQGTLQLPGDGEDLVSLVHAVDMARAVVSAAEAAPAGSIYNVVDDEPVSYKALFGYIAAQAGSAEPKTGGPKLWPSLSCSNASIKAGLQWQPAFPTFRSGLA